MKGEHSNSLQIYICFRQRSINKNYTNISVMTNNKSIDDKLCAHIVPWDIPSPFASNCCICPSRV